MECLSNVTDWLAVHAPIATAAVATLALVVAWRSLNAQRDTARKRAAIDIFFKTEMDTAVVAAYHAYDTAIKKYQQSGQSAEEFLADQADRRSILGYLNVHELTAVGIHNGVLDERVCFEFWADELTDAYTECKPLIEVMRREPNSRFSFIDLEELSDKWTKVNKVMTEQDLRHPIHL